MKKPPSGQAAPKKPLVAWPTARRPAWISDDELEWLPDDARQEAVELIASTYQELVVEASSALERAAGEEFVFLFWLGLLRSLRLRGHSRWLPGQPLIFGDRPETEIQNYLQLGLAKQRVANLLLRIKDWLARWRREAALQPVALRNAATNGFAADCGPSDGQPATASGDAIRSSRPDDLSGQSAAEGNGVHSHPSPLPAGAGASAHPGPLPEGADGDGEAKPEPTRLAEGKASVAGDYGRKPQPMARFGPCSRSMTPGAGSPSHAPAGAGPSDALEEPKSEGQNGEAAVKPPLATL